MSQELMSECPNCFRNVVVTVDDDGDTASGECPCGAMPVFDVVPVVTYKLGDLRTDARWGGLDEFMAGLEHGYKIEVYRFFRTRWSIAMARFLCQNGEVEVFDIPFGGDDNITVEVLANTWSLDEWQGDREQNDLPRKINVFGRNIDHDWAMSDKCDLSVPIILGRHRFEDGDEGVAGILLDGSHRLYRAFHTQVGIKAYALEEDETHWCLTMRYHRIDGVKGTPATEEKE